QKIWNVCRLAYPFIYGKKVSKPSILHPIDRWILQEHKKFLKTVKDAYDNFEFHIVIEQLYNYFWEKIADEYVELIKHRLFNEDQSVYYTFSRILKDIIVVLHPIAPHITEEIYSRLFGDKISVLLETFPTFDDIEDDEESLKLGDSIIKFNSIIRTEKIKNKLSMNTKVNIKLFATKDFIRNIMKVKDDLMKTHKIVNLEIHESNELKIELSVFTE
ncbi:MAG: class I tRNA ligase family protein, partial [Sulfolobaceae archaeon]